MKVLVIIPAYNEELSIKKACEKIIKLKDEVDYQLDYIIINDGSTDNTRKVCENNNFNVINLEKNLGIGGAVQTGYKYAYDNNYDIAVQFDGDGQHDERFINPLILPIINKDADMTIGSRFIGNKSQFKSTLLRQNGIRILSNILEKETGKRIYDITSGFRAINKEIIKVFKDDYPVDYPEPESLVKIIHKGFIVKEIPVVMYEREYGKSSITPLKSVNYMLKVSSRMKKIRKYYEH